MLRKILRLCSLLLLHHFSSSAQQYCTPAPAKGGAFINVLRFANQSGLTGGTDQSWNNNTDPAFLNRSGTSIGTAQRGCTVSFGFAANNLNSPTGSNTSINIRVFADWNGDGDFNDNAEIAFDKDYQLINFLSTGESFAVPAFSVNNPRVRFAIRQGGTKADACGSYVGNIQDFTLTVPVNTAPILNTSVTPFLNDLLETQMANDGMSVRQFIYAQGSSKPLVTDGGPCESIGIAITGTSGNGQWQFKADNSAWTNMGSISTTNALVLSGGAVYTGFDTRIRFVPSGAGTASITYKGWDQSQGTNGRYINASTGGGSTAFSTTTKTTSLTVQSTAATVADSKMYLPLFRSPTDVVDLSIASVSRATGSIKHTEHIDVANNNGYGSDVAIDAVNQKVIWSGGASAADIYRSNMDGTGVTKITNGTYNYLTGLAVSENKLFFCDYGNGIFSSNLDGTNVISISGGAGQANDISDVYDIEYGSYRIWYINRGDVSLPLSIMYANPNGTGTGVLYTAANPGIYISGLSVSTTHAYWTETNSDYVSSVKKINFATGTVTTLCSESDQQYYDLMADETNNLIYFSAYDASASNLLFFNSRIKTIPLTGGTPVQRLLLQDQAVAFTFYIPAVLLPVKVLGIEAYKGTQQIAVNWKVADEQEVVSYTVQKSTDGVHFEEAGKVAATGKSSYTWPDGNPVVGTNYYRISITDKSGKTTLTNTVKVDWLKEGTPSINVYPSIVSGNRQVQVVLQNMKPGSYTVKAVNALGQSIVLATLKCAGSSLQTVALPASVGAGTWWLQIGNGVEVWNEKLIVN